jgi:hypothetical protein
VTIENALIKQNSLQAEVNIGCLEYFSKLFLNLICGFWIVTLRSLVGHYWNFKWTYHHSHLGWIFLKTSLLYKCLQGYMVLQSRTPQPTSSLQQEPDTYDFLEWLGEECDRLCPSISRIEIVNSNCRSKRGRCCTTFMILCVTIPPHSSIFFYNYEMVNTCM